MRIHAPTFLCGCVAGTLVTFSLYFITVYITQNNAGTFYSQIIRDLGNEEVTTADSRQEEETTTVVPNVSSTAEDAVSPEKSWMESTLANGGESGAFTSVIHITARNYLLPVTFSSRGFLEGVLHRVNSTWGQRTEGWTVAVGTKGAEVSSSSTHHNHLLLAEECDDFMPSRTGYLDARHYFCLLTAIHDHYIDKYQWFAIVDSSTYVAVNHLVQTLLQFDSSELFYIGKPAALSITNMNEHGLVHNEHICELNAGIVLSRGALKQIAPHLRHCLGLGVSVGLSGKGGTADVELGRCFSRKLGVTCSHSIKVDTGRLFVSHPTHPLMLQDFITFYDVSSFDEMVRVYLYDLTREITTIVNMENSNSKLANSICRQLPSSELEPGTKSCNFSFTHTSITSPILDLVNTRPKRLDEILRWEILMNNKLFNSEKTNPVRGPPKSLSLEVQFVLNRTLQALGEKRRVTPVKIHNVYFRYNGLVGREYILDLLLKKQYRDPVEKRVTVVLPHLENMFQIESTDYPLVAKTIEFIVPLSGVNSRLNDFLEMYEELCLKPKEMCSLNLVVYGERDSEQIGEQLQQLQTKYPKARLRKITGKGEFSRGRALELGVALLKPSDLIFICDVDMIIEKHFLRRCRRNPIRGKRVYYPEFFKYYNMDYVYRFSKKPWSLSISRQNGHWAMYSYGMLCIYKSDYTSTGGFDTNIEGWGGEDVTLASRVLALNLDILRAPDPALSHRYHDKVCSTQLTPKQFSSCISSRNEDLADRTRLAEYVFYLEDKCKTKNWKLWS